jgi:hypothetical protein
MKQSTRLIGEFFLIVIGVLVALAVETALESRQDDGLRDEYIARIKLDIESDKRAVRHRIDFFSDVQQFSDQILVWLDTDVPVDHDVLLAAFYAAEVWPFVTNSSTYEDLLSTGNIRLLDDLDFRASLSNYHNKANTSRSGWNPSEQYRESIRGIIPNGVQSLIRQECPTTDETDEEPTGFPPCKLPGVDYEKLSSLFEPLKSDAAFRRSLTYRDSELGVMIYLLKQQVTFADQVLTRIESQ